MTTQTIIVDFLPKAVKAQRADKAISLTQIIVPKEKAIRKTMEEWKLDARYLEVENQLAYLCTKTTVERQDKRTSDATSDATSDPDIDLELRRQVCAKISGYKSQDMKKGLFDESKFVCFDDVIKLMTSSKMECFYCKKPSLLFYEYVRDRCQWTLERIDNSRGHNIDNVEIACLDCNLRRRTMYHERYLFTKQIGIVKLV
jgi:hypothetical protein